MKPLACGILYPPDDIKSVENYEIRILYSSAGDCSDYIRLDLIVVGYISSIHLSTVLLLFSFLIPDHHFIPNVMSSAQEAETGMGFLNARDAVPIRQSLNEIRPSTRSNPHPI